MSRFQLVFQYPDGDRSEIRDNNVHGEPHIDGKLIVDGETYVIRDVEWLVRSDDIGDAMKRFACTLVVQPADETDLT
jgi:hypothetical protein